MKFPGFEWAPYNINVNCIGPGFYKTDLARPLFETPGWLPRWMEEILKHILFDFLYFLSLEA